MLTDYLVAEIDLLARAGATLGLLAANTPHIVFDGSDAGDARRFPWSAFIVSRANTGTRRLSEDSCG